MKVFLLHKDQDFQVKPQLRDEIFDAMLSSNLYAIRNVRRNRERPPKTTTAPAPASDDDALTQDLELDTLWSAMAAGDEFLFETAKRGVLSSLSDPEAIVLSPAGARRLPRAAARSSGRSTTSRSKRSRTSARPVGGYGTATGPTRSCTARFRC